MLVRVPPFGLTSHKSAFIILEVTLGNWGIFFTILTLVKPCTSEVKICVTTSTFHEFGMNFKVEFSNQDGTSRWRSRERWNIKSKDDSPRRKSKMEIVVQVESPRWQWKSMKEVQDRNLRGRIQDELFQDGYRHGRHKPRKYGNFGGLKVLSVGRSDLGGSKNPPNLKVFYIDEKYPLCRSRRDIFDAI